MQKTVAIVTGASSGMGREFARRIAQEYALDEMWVVARGKERLEALAKELSVPVRPLPLDLTRAESAAHIKMLLDEEKPTVRVLCNASGYGIFDRFADSKEEDLVGMIDLNCRALTALCHCVLPYCKAGSTIVNIASVAAFQPVPFGAVYAASKAYVLSLTRALNRELKPRNIKALAVCPYWTKTAFFDRSNGKNLITRFDCMYEPEFIVRKTIAAMKKKKDYIVPGTVAKVTHALTKLLPHSLVMRVFERQQKLH